MPTQVQPCSSFSPSVPWMIPTLSTAEVLGVQRAHPGGSQIQDNESHQGTPSSGSSEAPITAHPTPKRHLLGDGHFPVPRLQPG